jgi:hypothetical protein
MPYWFEMYVSGIQVIQNAFVSWYFTGTFLVEAPKSIKQNKKIKC